MIREEIPIDEIQLVLVNEAKCIIRQGNLEAKDKCLYRSGEIEICDNHDCAHCDLLLPDKMILRSYEALLQHLDVLKAQGYENLLATTPETVEEMLELIGGQES